METRKFTQLLVMEIKCTGLPPNVGEPVKWAIDRPALKLGREFDYSEKYLENLKLYDTFTSTNKTIDQTSMNGFYENSTKGLGVIHSVFSLIYGEDFGTAERSTELNEEFDRAREQYDKSFEELSARVSSGEKVSLDDLETKITIAGTEISLGKLVDMQKMTKDLFDIDLSRFESGGYANTIFSRIETSRAVASVYADTLGGELGERFKASVGKVLDAKSTNYRNWVLELQDSEERMLGTSRSDIYMERIDKTNELFSKLDTSSLDSFKVSFNETITDFKDILKNYLKEFYSDDYADTTTKFMNTLLKHFN